MPTSKAPPNDAGNAFVNQLEQSKIMTIPFIEYEIDMVTWHHVPSLTITSWANYKNNFIVSTIQGAQGY